ncbi:MAG: hypothetical protein ABEL76_00600 [Bradymonadaceae bacterium]
MHIEELADEFERLLQTDSVPDILRNRETHWMLKIAVMMNPNTTEEMLRDSLVEPPDYLTKFAQARLEAEPAEVTIPIGYIRDCPFRNHRDEQRYERIFQSGPALSTFLTDLFEWSFEYDEPEVVKEVVPDIAERSAEYVLENLTVGTSDEVAEHPVECDALPGSGPHRLTDVREVWREEGTDRALDFLWHLAREHRPILEPLEYEAFFGETEEHVPQYSTVVSALEEADLLLPGPVAIEREAARPEEARGARPPQQNLGLGVAHDPPAGPGFPNDGTGSKLSDVIDLSRDIDGGHVFPGGAVAVGVVGHMTSGYMHWIADLRAPYHFPIAPERMLQRVLDHAYPDRYRVTSS